MCTLFFLLFSIFPIIYLTNLFKANETQKRIKMKEKVYCVTGCWSEIKQDRIVASRVVLFIHEKVTDAVTSYWYKKKKKKETEIASFLEFILH